MKIIINRVLDSRPGEEDRTIDMTPQGEFRTPPPAPWSARILRYAIIVAVLAAGVAVAALMLWFALILIPVALGAALIAYAAFRYRVWQARKARSSGGGSSGGGDIYRH